MRNLLSRAVFVGIFFLILTVIFTYPLMSRFTGYIPGFTSTDEPYAALWYFHWLKHAVTEGISAFRVDAISAPFVMTIEPGYVFWNQLNKWLAYLTGPVFTYNLQVVLSFILSGVFTYFLGRFFIKGNAAALVAAVIFAFSPYHAVRSWQHLGLSFIQWIPLYILSLFFLQKNKTVKYAFFSALCFVLVMAFDLYYAYFMFIVAILFIAFDYFYYRNFRDNFKLVKLIFVSFFLALIIESFDLYQIAKFMFGAQKSHIAHGVYGYVRPFEDLFAQSARPLSYLLPATTHPIFGKFTENFIGTALYGGSFTEHTLYLGWAPLVLAFIAFRRRRKDNFYVGFFIFLAFAAWIFSQPPWWNIFGFKLYMPSFFMYKIAPMFRAYCRFGIVAMLAVAILAGMGLEFILGRLKTQKAKFTAAVLFCVLVLFEFWNYPPYKVIDVSRVPEVYYWLKEQPGDFTVAEYPLDVNGANEMYKFYQTAHGKKIINGTTPGTYANKVAKEIMKLSAPKTTGALKWMGVRFVLVHKQDYLNTELIEDRNELDKIPQNPGLKLIKAFAAQDCPRQDIMCIQKTAPIDVYEVIARPIRPELE